MTGNTLARGLDIATIAQSIAGGRPSPAALLATLAEAGIQARLRRRRETLDAVRRSERLFESLPPEAIAADGIRVSEYCVRWHQSNALTDHSRRTAAGRSPATASARASDGKQ